MTENIGIVLADFYPDFSKKMLSSARTAAKKNNLKIKKIIRTYGVFDVPLHVKLLLKKKEIKGVAVLGCALKGKTAHDKVIVEAVASALTKLSLDFEKPVSLGIIGYNAKRTVAVKRLKEYSIRAIESLKKSFSEIT